MSQDQITKTTETLHHNPEEAEKPHNEEEHSEEDHASSMQHSESPFLVGMNMFMIIASLTSSNHDFVEYEDTNKGGVQEQQDGKPPVSKLKSRKREFDQQLKIPDRRAPRIQTRVLDSRHGRKM